MEQLSKDRDFMKLKYVILNAYFHSKVGALVRFLNVFEKKVFCTCQNQYSLKKNNNIVKYYFFYSNIFKNVFFPCDGKAQFSASLIHSSVSHDPSEIILICRCGAQEMLLMIRKAVVLLNIFRIQHLLEIEIFLTFIYLINLMHPCWIKISFLSNYFWIAAYKIKTIKNKPKHDFKWKIYIKFPRDRVNGHHV